MSRNIDLILVRKYKDGKFKTLMTLEDINIVKDFADDLVDYKIAGGDVIDFINMKNNIDEFVPDLEVYDINSFYKCAEFAVKRINEYEKRIADIKERLNVYYSGGKHCPEIEADLLEELHTYQECVSANDADWEGNSFDYNWYFILKTINKIINSIEIICDYGFNEWDKDYKDYIVLR